MKIPVMSFLFEALLICAFLAPPVASAAQAQDTPRPSAPDSGSQGEKRYVSPPAWKSVEVGNFYLRRKKYRAALSRFQEAAKTDPYNPQAYRGMGKVYDRLGLKQKALENYRKYLDLLPSSKDAEEAKDVQNAIHRLEEQLNRGKNPPPATTTAPSVSNP